VRRLAPAFGAIVLAGCATQVPSVPEAARVTPPATWRTPAVKTAKVEPQWWRAFGDPVLTGLVERALANNTDIAIATARVREARAQERLARSQLFPSLDLGGGVTRSRSVGPLGTAGESTAAQPLFQAAYELDLFGRLGDQVDAAQRAALATQAGADAAALSVAAATGSGYITLRALDARLDILEATLASRAEALRIARDRARVGYTSQLELRQAEAEYEATAQSIPQARLQIARQEDALSVLVGDAPAATSRGSPLDRIVLPPVPEGLPADLLRRRPDIAQAELTLAASDASLSAARAQFLPQVRLTASAGAVLSSALADPIAIWSVGGSVLAPIFNGGRLQAQLDTAAARRDQAAFGYRRTVLTAFREVEDNLAAAQQIALQRARLESQTTATAEALRHATNRYQAGYSSYLEQLDAQRALLTAQLAVVQARSDELNATVALYQAMGGGW
jgi:multidrug efflux system outer membrane protein